MIEYFCKIPYYLLSSDLHGCHFLKLNLWVTSNQSKLIKSRLSQKLAVSQA